MTCAQVDPEALYQVTVATNWAAFVAIVLALWAHRIAN